ncbi:F-box only protein 4 [Patella vulgata]|uniref:F-box only protein 4 n=1 Tax=Patella vulgata TaxID=6465 RepID=UPI0021802950|nr:F-box only protein 4 [Patella vulgata]
MEFQKFPVNCESENIRIIGNNNSNFEIDLDEEINIVFHSVKDLMKKYIMYSKTSESKVVSGGLQQFLIRKMRGRSRKKETPDPQLHFKKNNNSCSIAVSDGVNKDKNSEMVSYFDCMPVNVKLNIFSYLPTKDLINITSVCHEWNLLATDDLLWHQRLDWDLPKWEVLSFTTNPKMYQEVNSEWSYKEIYMKCSPEANRSWKKINSTFYQVSNMLKYFFPKKAPRVAMFGPGLETSTHKLVRKLLYEDNDKFSRIAMFPGQFDGVGAGMTLKLKTGSTFHLTVLYSGTKQEREKPSHRNRANHSRLFINSTQDKDNTGIELQPAVKNLCHTLDAFIFVVDASQPEELVKSALMELKAMVNERSSAPHVPVVILSCISDKTDVHSKIPACRIVELLELVNLDKKWLVHDCVVTGLEGLHLAMEWMVEHAQNK